MLGGGSDWPNPTVVINGTSIHTNGVSYDLHTGVGWNQWTNPDNTVVDLSCAPD